MPRRISRASRTPAVVIRPVRAPRRVRVALVVTVVPWTITSIDAMKAAKSSAASSRRPLMTPTEGSSGVDSTLWITGSTPPARTKKSVNVPPTSMPTFNRGFSEGSRSRQCLRASTSITTAMAVSPAAQPWNRPRPPPRIVSSSISSMTERKPVGPCGWPHTSEQP